MKTINYLIIIILSIFTCSCKIKETKKKTTDSPRIVNIINFVRQLEPRVKSITEDILYETVVQQVRQLSDYELPSTFLLQYDALINPRYQELLKNELYPGSEIGGWWEITQPHVEDAGLIWRGSFPWDPRADVSFATGYSPEERIILVDIYMDKFKSIFGQYPTSIGSWFIDAHSLSYMSEKYNIVASCNCKDQIGTDGYTLWGGYWNQAYYPSKKNAYMPAQTIEGQIPIPIFRMLGSDPIYQYEAGLGGSHQSVVSLEPLNTDGGGNRQWVEWFFKTMFDEPCLAFGYTQVGQENSFTWDRMKEGLEIQIPLLASLYKENKIRVETLTESGVWFKKQFATTPPTAVTALEDPQNNKKKSVWYNSRFYRANLMWNDSSFRFRDIHLFNENFESNYLYKAGTGSKSVYTTLPFVDGFSWSTKDKLAGIRLMSKNKYGKINEIKGGTPIVNEMEDGILKIEWPLENNFGILQILFFEDEVEIRCDYSQKESSWFLEFTASTNAELPFENIYSNKIEASFKGFDYTISCSEAVFENNSIINQTFRIIPNKQKIILKFTSSKILENIL